MLHINVAILYATIKGGSEGGEKVQPVTCLVIPGFLTTLVSLTLSLLAFSAQSSTRDALSHMQTFLKGKFNLVETDALKV